MKASETRIFYGRTKTEDVSSGKERRGRRIVEKKIVGFKRIKHEKNNPEIHISRLSFKIYRAAVAKCLTFVTCDF